MYTSNWLSKNRVFIYHFLRRTQRFNCPISGTFHFDVTDLLQAIQKARSDGRRIGMVACLTRATAKAMEANPRLNNRIFHGLFGKREVSFDHIHCGMLAGRKDNEGEDILIPVIIPNANELSVDEIHSLIKDNKSKPLEELDAYNALEKARNLPRFIIPLVHYLFRASPKLGASKSSTYGISSIMQEGSKMVSSSAPANQTTFFPVSLGEQAVAYKGEVAVRTIMAITICVDHFLVDGMDAQRCGETLQEYLENPEKLLG